MKNLPMLVSLFIPVWFYSNTGYMLFPVFVFSTLLLLLSFIFYNFNGLSISRSYILSLAFVFIYIVSATAIHANLLFDTYLIEDTASEAAKLLLCLIIFLVIFRWAHSGRFRSNLLTAITVVLCISLVAFFVQVYYLYVEGFHVNYLEFFMGREQRIRGTAGIKGLYRPSGAYNEPGTYAVFTYVLILIRYMLKQRLDSLFWVAFATTIITLSVQAIVSAFLFIMLFVLLASFNFFCRMKLRKIHLFYMLVASAVTVVVMVLFFDLAMPYLEARFSSAGDATVSVRKNSVIVYLDQMFFTYIIGIGVNNFGLGVLINDTGFFFSTLVQYGILGLFFVLIPLYVLIRTDYLAFSLYFIILLSKLSLQYPIVWVCLALIYRITVPERKSAP